MMNAIRLKRFPPGAADCHAHVIKKNAPLVPERHSAPARDCDVYEYLNLLDTNGVTYGLLTAPSFYGSNNEVLLEALKNANGRLKGTAIVEPTATESELARMKASGVCGLRLNWIRRDKLPDITSSDYTALFAKACNLGLHIEIYLEGELLAPVLQQIRRSSVQVVIDHFGNPIGPDASKSKGFNEILKAMDEGKTWVKLSAPYRLRDASPKELIQKIIEHSGGERAVWATDWPWVGYENKVTYDQCIDWIFQWIPDETTRNKVLVTNPQILFGFPSYAEIKV